MKNKISFTRKELEVFAAKALGVQHIALRRMSTQFLAQLLQLNMKGDADVCEMVNEINHLEDFDHGLPSSHMTVHGNRKRSEAWIVFKRYNGSNYYLTLASMDEGDISINQRLRDAYQLDFPFLENKYKLN